MHTINTSPPPKNTPHHPRAQQQRRAFTCPTPIIGHTWWCPSPLPPPAHQRACRAAAGAHTAWAASAGACVHRAQLMGGTRLAQGWPSPSGLQVEGQSEQVPGGGVLYEMGRQGGCNISRLSSITRSPPTTTKPTIRLGLSLGIVQFINRDHPPPASPCKDPPLSIACLSGAALFIACLSDPAIATQS